MLECSLTSCFDGYNRQNAPDQELGLRKSMFQIKICGITAIDDAIAAADAGADAIGLNFYPKSSRFVDMAAARQIVNALPTAVKKVGVFVNAEAAEVRSAVHQLSLDIVQLHGDETPDFVASLANLPVVRAFRPDRDFESVYAYIKHCDVLNCRPAMILIDAFKPGEYGGTGEAADWNAVSRLRATLNNIPVVLAGGLNPENVASAISLVRPWAVDTASGVENSPRRKSKDRMQAFVAEAKRAFDLQRSNR